MRVSAGQPVVEEAEGDADVGGDGGLGVAGRVGLHLRAGRADRSVGEPGDGQMPWSLAAVSVVMRSG